MDTDEVAKKINERDRERREKFAQRNRDRGYDDNKKRINDFWEEFGKKKKNIVEDYGQVKTLFELSQNVTPTIQKIEKDIFDLQQLTTKATLHLPPYDIRSAQQQITTLSSEFSKLKAECYPRQPFKFSFRSRQPKQDTPKPLEVPTLDTKPSLILPSNEKSIANLEDTTIVHNSGEFSEYDLSIKNLNKCTIHILDHKITAVRIFNLKNCKILIAPLMGSILLESCENCVFSLACHQLRIHTSESCDFYVATKSAPIIEKCTKLRFGPYHLETDRILCELEKCLGEKEKLVWDTVLDFDYPDQPQSRNWSIIPEEQRKNERL